MKEELALRFTRYTLTIFLIISINFLIPRMMPGDPIMYLFGEDVYAVSREIIEELRRSYGLDKPMLEQYVIYLQRILHGDFGYSFSFGRPVIDIILERLPRTLLLTLPPTITGSLIGMYLGTICGWRSERAAKKILSVGILVVYSVPTFWLGMLFLLFFSLKLNLFPSGGAPSGEDIQNFLSHIFLPFITLTLFTASHNSLLMRGIVIGTSRGEFVLTALSKGLPYTVFLNRHLIKPSLPPFIANAAMEFGFAFSGALLVEIVFSWPGLGLTMWEAVIARDYPLLQAIFVFSALTVVLANGIADLLCVIIDPRLRRA